MIYWPNFTYIYVLKYVCVYKSKIWMNLKGVKYVPMH